MDAVLVDLTRRLTGAEQSLERLLAVEKTRLRADETVPPGQTTVLIPMTVNNHQATPGGSLMYGIRLDTDTDAVDTAAAISVSNVGHSDNVYLGVSGKPGSAATTPTGIGIDLNKQPGSGAQQNSQHRGYGIQIYDWSTSNIGVDGPTGIYILKKSNLNTDHVGLEIVANRFAWRVITDPSVAGYDGAQPLFGHFRADTGATLWQWNAGGNLVWIADALGLYWDGGTGKRANLRRNDTRLDLTMMSGGLRFLKSDGSKSYFEFTDLGGFSIRQPDEAVPFLVEGGAQVEALTIDNGLADGGALKLNSQGYNAWELDNFQSHLRFITGGAERARLRAEGWLHVIPATSAPLANPASGGYLYVDPATGALRYRGSAGTVTTLANP